MRRVAAGSSDFDAYARNVSGEPATPLVEGVGSGEFGAVWSPDGAWVAFSTDRHGSSDIALVPADGGAIRMLTDSPDEEFLPQWTPDGSTIVFEQAPTDHKIVTVSVEALLEGRE